MAALILSGFVAWYIWVRLGREAPLPGLALEQLTDAPGQELFPSLSPDSKFVAYSASGHLFLQDIGKKTRTDLTPEATSQNWQPAVSPDGQRLAFRSEREGGGLFVVPVAGGPARRLTDFGYNPVWSADGSELLCATETFLDPESRTTVGSSLWTVKVATGEKRQITRPETIPDAVEPHWSPHGDRIAYWSAQNGTPSLWTVSGRGDDPVPVVPEAHVNWNPVWSPDGRHLYFASDRGGEMDLWRVRIEERTGRQQGPPVAISREPGFGGFVSLSRDGQHLAYVKASRRANLQQTAFDPVHGTIRGHPASITQGPRLVFGPHLSPDGKWFVFFSWGRREALFLVGSDGKGPWELNNGNYRNRWPRWSPDGKRIAFQSNRSGQYQIWATHPDGTGLEQLTNSAEPVILPVWSPDGGLLAYSSDTSSFIMTLDKPWREQSPPSLPPWSEPGARFEAYSWSPDGSKLAGHLYRGRGNTETAGIVIYSFQNRTYQQLTDGGNFPVWLHDSGRVMFSHGDRILIADIKSGKVHEVLSTTPPAVFGLSVDDRLLYFTSVSVEADIWMATLKARP